MRQMLREMPRVAGITRVTRLRLSHGAKAKSLQHFGLRPTWYAISLSVILLSASINPTRAAVKAGAIAKPEVMLDAEDVVHQNRTLQNKTDTFDASLPGIG